MANPQAEDGHIDIANELGDALACTYLNPSESKLLWAILRKTYGWHKKTDRISYTQFEEITKLDRWHIAPILRKLKERQIITVLGTGYNLAYGIQKDYDKWDANPKYKIKKKKLILDGYIYVYVGPKNQYRPMANQNGYVALHRLVMAKSLGRLLNADEIVHHVDHDRTNDKLDNLELTNNLDHTHETADYMRQLHQEIADTNKKSPPEVVTQPLRELVTQSLPDVVTSTQSEPLPVLGKPLPVLGKPLPEVVTQPLRELVTPSLPEVVTSTQSESLPVLEKPLPVLEKPLPEVVTQPLRELVNTKSIKSITKEKQKQEMPPLKQKFGEFDNVFLTVQEYEKLVNKFGEVDAKRRIEKLSGYIKSHGYERKYKDHYATILTWARDDDKVASGETKSTRSDFWRVR